MTKIFSTESATGAVDSRSKAACRLEQRWWAPLGAVLQVKNTNLCFHCTGRPTVVLFARVNFWTILLQDVISRRFIKGWAPSKLTGCEQDLAINLPGCFDLLFLLSFIRETKNAQLKNPTDLPHKNLIKPLDLHQLLAIYPNPPPLYRVVR